MNQIAAKLWDGIEHLTSASDAIGARLASASEQTDVLADAKIPIGEASDYILTLSYAHAQLKDAVSAAAQAYLEIDSLIPPARRLATAARTREHLRC